MKKTFKKSIACLIAVLMVFSAMPLSAFAWDNGNLTFVKKDTSWDGYAGKYSAYVHNGTNNDFMGIVLKEVSSDGVIEVRKGSSFDITLSCGTWTSSSASNGTLPNNTLSWHYGNKDTDYVISSVDSSGSGLTHWKAFLGDDTTTEIQSAIEGEFATAATPSDNFRARASEGGTNEAYGVFKFTPTSFSQLNTPGVYTVRLAPTLVMNHWEGRWGSKKWEPKFGWGNYQWSINQGSPDTSRTIAITVRVVEDYNFVNAAGDTVKTVTTTKGASDAYKQRPDNTANSYTSNKNGTHNSKIYSWPTSPSGTTFTETYYTVDNEQCSGGTATCTTKKVCRGCGVEYGDVDSNNHTGLVSMPGQDATCSTDGYFAYQHCNDCDADVGKDVIPATGEHSYTVLVTGKQEATCTTPGKEAVYKCATCELTNGGATIPATGHSWGKPEYNEETKSDVFTCEVCKDTYSKAVADMSALNDAIKLLEAAINVDDAAYKYEVNALENAKKTLADAKKYALSNRYATKEEVDAQIATVLSAETELTVNGLAKYSQTFIIKKDDGNGEPTELARYTDGYASLPYGSTVEFNKYTIPPIEDENSTLNGLPMYAVYKWVKIVNGVEQKLAATDVQISDVVKGETTYICYVLDFKATDDTQKTTRVRYLDKSGNTIEFDTAEVGSNYKPKDSVKYPNLPYYVFDHWECVFGTPENVGTREIVFKAKYKYDETTLANQCTIQGFGNVKVNGESSCSATYDSKVTLTGATKYAFCDENKKIISYINNDYIYTPHVNNEIVYIIGVDEEEAKKATTAITGSFVQTNAGKLDDGETDYHNLYVNAQYYLPEGTKAVEAGIVISKSKNTENDLQIGKTGVTKLMSDTQSPNHEYSMAMSFVNQGTINVRSYLICVDGSGNTYTVYSAVKTIAYSA